MKNENTKNYGVLEFSEIKDDLKAYLKNQEEFKDYNFEGSNLQVILDLLAYNSHYNNAYRSFAIQENFLASASRRQNIISIGDQLGYIPHSATCSRCVVDLIFSDFKQMPSTVILDNTTKFLTTVDTSNFQFQVSPENDAYKGTPIYIDPINEELLCTSEEAKANGFIFENVKIIEGIAVENFFDVNDSEQYKFTIMNPMADLSTLKIAVFPNADVLEAANNDPNYLNTNILKPSLSLYNKTDSFTYYYRESSENTFEIIFKLGYLQKGNVIKMEYYNCNGAAANGAINFRLDNYKGMFANSNYIPNTIIIRSKEASNSGSSKESIESIRENAPRFYAAQDRAVTEDDYKSLLINKFGYIDSISVWGGEKEREPEPGKVFIAIKPADSRYLTESQKTEVIAFCNNKKTSSVSVELKDINFFDVLIQVDSVYNKNKTSTSKTFGEMYDEINKIINVYCSNNLKKFGFVYQESALTKEILDLSYLTSVNITTTIKHEIDTTVKSINSVYNVDFSNSIEVNGLTSSSFSQYTTNGTINSIISDDGNGNVIVTNTSTFEKRTIGTINYDTGVIQFWDFMARENTITLYIIPKNKDIINTRDNLLDLSNTNSITINMTEESDKTRFTS